MVQGNFINVKDEERMKEVLDFLDGAKIEFDENFNKNDRRLFGNLIYAIGNIYRYFGETTVRFGMYLHIPPEDIEQKERCAIKLVNGFNRFIRNVEFLGDALGPWVHSMLDENGHLTDDGINYIVENFIGEANRKVLVELRDLVRDFVEKATRIGEAFDIDECPMFNQTE